MYQAQKDISIYTRAHKLLNKVEDLWNCSRRNGLQINGLPESYKPNSLSDICSKTIPGVLGLTITCMIERAHCIGTYSDERTSYRPVMVSFPNCG